MLSIIVYYTGQHLLLFEKYSRITVNIYSESFDTLSYCEESPKHTSRSYKYYLHVVRFPLLVSDAGVQAGEQEKT